MLIKFPFCDGGGAKVLAHLNSPACEFVSTAGAIVKLPRDSGIARFSNRRVANKKTTKYPLGYRVPTKGRNPGFLIRGNFWNVYERNYFVIKKAGGTAPW